MENGRVCNFHERSRKFKLDILWFCFASELGFDLSTSRQYMLVKLFVIFANNLYKRFKLQRWKIISWLHELLKRGGRNGPLSLLLRISTVTFLVWWSFYLKSELSGKGGRLFYSRTEVFKLFCVSWALTSDTEITSILSILIKILKDFLTKF